MSNHKLKKMAYSVSLTQRQYSSKKTLKTAVLQGSTYCNSIHLQLTYNGDAMKDTVLLANILL